jgi:hypothetical protein
MKNNPTNAVLAAALLTLSAAPAFAADNYWTNANGTNRWVEAGNWSLGRVPNSGDNAIIAWGPNTTSVIIDAFAVCGSFTNGNNQTIISGNGYLRVHNSAHIAGGLFMYGTIPVLETLGTTRIFNTAQLYSGALRQGVNGTVSFEVGCATTFPVGTPGISIEGGRVVNWGEWNINNGGFSLGNYNDSDPLTTLENATGGIMKFNNPGSIFDPSTPGHNGGNSVFINRWSVQAMTSGYNVIESDIQYWVLDFGATVAGGNAFIDIKNPVNLNPAGFLDGGDWAAYDNGAIVFAGGSRAISEIGGGADVYMDGPNAHVYGIDQVVSIRGYLSVYGGKQLLLQPPVGLTQHSGRIYVGTGSSITLWQSFGQLGGTIQRQVSNAADMQTPALNCTGTASISGNAYIHYLDPALATPNSLCKVVSGGWGVGGGFAQVSASVFGTYGGFNTSNDAYARVVPPCEADLNNDGLINTADLVIFLGQFGSTQPNRFDGADFNGDTSVNTADLTFFLGRFGRAC